MPCSYLIAGCRTPIGKFLGSLSAVAAPQLGATAIREAVHRAGVRPEEIDEVIMGCVLAAGVGQAPARQAALAAGLPPTVAALTINKVCGSGLKSVMLADQAIRAGDARLIVAGGMESMSRAPHLLIGAREGWKFGNQTVLDSMVHDGLWCAFENVGMGEEAEYIAASRQVTRSEQDVWSAASHRRAIAAQAAGTFDAEIVPVDVPGKKGTVHVANDEGPRADSTLESLARLRPAFQTAGTVTAGNSSQLSDGAAALVVADESTAERSESPLMARIVAAATSGVAPKEIFIAPVIAIEKALAKAELTLADIDLIELNEAFAAQCVACARPLGLDPEKTNISGGAIALGHPIGASGARVLVTLLHALHRLGLKRGLAALCLGGGNAVAMIIERG
ncbi:MAG TPA: acetyl-CoA C-acetyltransferase [Pirellulales bacterium]|jgi:acetyl-CoA C-acetyltransferase|nr:acetyl-CoA C-acetyltransferase [Pirellulales bacterium]